MKVPEDWAHRRELLRNAVRNAHALGPIYVETARAYLAEKKVSRHQDLYEEINAMLVGDTLVWSQLSPSAEAVRKLAYLRAHRLGFKVSVHLLANGMLSIKRVS